MNNPHKKVDKQIIGACLVMFVIALVLLLTIGGPKADAATKPPQRFVCFPVSIWDANPGKRPCHRILSVEEDGSGRLELGTARRAIARCVIPNVREERGSFTIKCWKVSK
jgi:hypothetical protein